MHKTADMHKKIQICGSITLKIYAFCIDLMHISFYNKQKNCEKKMTWRMASCGVFRNSVSQNFRNGILC